MFRWRRERKEVRAEVGIWVGVFCRSLGDRGFCFVLEGDSTD